MTTHAISSILLSIYNPQAWAADNMPNVSTSSLIGVAIACSGNVLISLALTVQKLAHRRQEQELHAQRRASSSSGSGSGGSSREGSPKLGHRHKRRKSSQSPNGTPRKQIIDDYSSSGATGTSTNGTLVAAPAVVIVDPQATSVPDPEHGLHLIGAVPLRPESPRRSTSSGESGSSSRSKGKSPPPIRLLHDSQENTPPAARHVKHSHAPDNGEEHKSTKEEVEEGAYLRSKLWWLGMLLITVGEGGNFLSYGFAPASVVAPLGTVALIANCVFAPLILRERFHPRELIGMGLAILGAVTVVYASNDTNPRLNPSQLIEAFTQIPFIVYTSLTILFVIIFMLLSSSARFGGRYIFIDIGTCALFGGYTVLSTKAFSSLLSTMFFDAFRYWVTWLLVAVLVGTSIMQIKYLNRALMRFQSKEVIPTQFVFFSMAAIIGSAVLFQEFRNISFSRFVNFAFGIATTFLGVYLLTSLSGPDDGEETDDEAEHPPQSGLYATRTASYRSPRPSYTPLLSPHLFPTPSERTPLLINGTPRRGTEELVLVPGSMGKRLLKRNSIGDFAPTLGLGSQAGFLLLASTPPGPGGASLKRARSSSRALPGAAGSAPLGRSVSREVERVDEDGMRTG